MVRAKRVFRLCSLAAIVAVTGAVVVPSGAAHALTRTVAPGESIQAAVNAAAPGDVIRVQAGVFREAVEVTKNNISIIGAGPGSTVLRPPVSSPHLSPICQDPSAPTSLDGFCVHGQFDAKFNLKSPVSNVRISGFTVRDFTSIGVVFFGASSPRADNNSALHNAEYGITAFVSTNDRFTNNIANDNGEAGIYVGDSPHANAVVSNNVANGNNNGIFIRDASGASGAPGRVVNNDVRGNCIGILFLDTGSGNAHWNAGGNTANANDKFCPPEDGPAISGVGIAVGGARDVNVHDNLVNNNVPSKPADVAGGIVVASVAGPPANVTVKNNTAHRNQPADLVWDGSGTGITFVANDCTTSIPAGLC
jgi:parallel beta-helix repeat protein